MDVQAFTKYSPQTNEKQPSNHKTITSVQTDPVRIHALPNMITCATRLHGNCYEDDKTLSTLTRFLNTAQHYADHIVIATEYVPGNPMLFDAVTKSVKCFKVQNGSSTDCKSTCRTNDSDDETPYRCSSGKRMPVFHVLPITNWNGFTPALNALAAKAAAITSGSDLILYQSVEILPSQAAVAAMRQHMLDNSATQLVVGASLQGHEFSSSFLATTLSGCTSPWNTLAMWNINKLLRTGFLPISDGHVSAGGVEEVACLAVQHALFPSTSDSSLLKFNDSEINWITKFNGEDRVKYHRKKMASKMERAQNQLNLLNMNHSTAMVSHIDMRSTYGAVQRSKSAPTVVPPKYMNPLIRNKSLRMKKNKKTTTTTSNQTFSSSSSSSLSPSYTTDQRSIRVETYDPIPSVQPHCNAPEPATRETRTFDYVTPSIDFQKETVLLTGGAGFIGSHTAEKLLMRGNKIVIIDDFNDYYSVQQKQDNITYLKALPMTTSDNLIVVHGDIRNKDTLALLFETHSPTLVIHLAARAGVRPSLEDPHIYVETNVGGTTNLLELSRIHQVKHFVYASSSSVYGGSDKNEFTELDIVDQPVSPYAATKKATELLASTYNHLYDLNTAGLRFFTVYGPRGRPDMAPYKFLKRAATGVQIDQYGDGTSERDYTYVSDIVEGIVRCLDRPAGCQVYNLGNGRPITLKRFIGLVSDVAAPAKGLDINYMPEQPGDVRRTCADITKASEMLGYNPRTKFETGLELTFKWMVKALAKKQ